MYFSTYGRASSALYQLASSNRGIWIVPDNSCHVLPATLISAGCIPVIADIDSQTLCISLPRLTRLFRDYEILGVVWVRTFGNNCLNHEQCINYIKSLSDTVLVVDDRCLCFPSLEKPSGSADMVLFSTGYGKPVDISYGGFCYTRFPLGNSGSILYSSDSEAKFNSLHKDHVRNEKPLSTHHRSIILSHWINHCLPVSQDEYMNNVAESLAHSYEHKKLVNHIYNLIDRRLILGNDWNTWRFQLKIKNPEQVLTQLFARGLFASRHYYSLSILYKNIVLPACSNYYWRELSPFVVNLFNDLRCSEAMAYETAIVVNKYALPFDPQ